MAVTQCHVQITKATAKFVYWSHGGGWRFDQWNSWRMQDGLLCRSNNDCGWLDDDLQCQDYEFDFSVSRGWFGGRYADIVGECECRDGLVWDDSELSCEAAGWGGVMIFLFLILGAVGCGVLCVAGLAIWRRIK